MINEAEKYAVGFECGIWRDDKFWFVDMRENALYYWEQETVHFVGQFIEEEGERLFSDVKLYGNKLIFVPLLANKIALYDLKEEQFSYIALQFERSTEHGLFSFSVIWKDYMYMFPLHYFGVMKLNLQNGDMKLVDEFGIESKDVCDEFCAPYFRDEYCQVEDKLYIPFMSNDALLEFDLSNDTGRIINLGLGRGFTSIARNEDDFWLCSRKRSGEEAVVVRWNRLSNIIDSYPINLPTNSVVEPIGSICNEKYCWFFLTHPNKVLKIELSTGKVCEEELFVDINNAFITPFSAWWASFIYCQKYNDGVLLCDGKSSKVIWFEPNAGELKSWTLKMPEERRPFYKKTISKLYNTFLQEEKKKDIHRESSCFGPIDMIEDLVE